MTVADDVPIIALVLRSPRRYRELPR